MKDSYIQASVMDGFVYVRDHDADPWTLLDIPKKDELDTLRDQFASAALTGLMSACNSNGEWTYGTPKETAIYSYELADAMLKAREES